jgi:hypothetical protein
MSGKTVADIAGANDIQRQNHANYAEMLGGSLLPGVKTLRALRTMFH